MIKNCFYIIFVLKSWESIYSQPLEKLNNFVSVFSPLCNFAFEEIPVEGNGEFDGIHLQSSPTEGDLVNNNGIIDDEDGDLPVDDDEEEQDEVDDSGMDAGLASESENDDDNNEEPDSDLIVLDPDHVSYP